MMFRFLYRCVLRAHPQHFRERFADEMLCIFDHAEGKFAAAALVLDGAISLMRQWALRPQFWDTPAVAVSDGVPFFHTCQDSTPRLAALVAGALLSLMVLNGVCWTLGYAWNHPIFMDIRPGYGPSGKVPESKLISRPMFHQPVAAEPSVYMEQGRVLLVFNKPRPARH